jgi:hypothetical protein
MHPPNQKESHGQRWLTRPLFQRPPPPTHTITTECGGTGPGAYCRVTKTRGWYERQVEEKRPAIEELREVEALRRPAAQQ